MFVYKMNFLGNQCQWLHCDECRRWHPETPPIRLAKATRKRQVKTIKGFGSLPGMSIKEQVGDFFDDPSRPSIEKYTSEIGTIKLETSRVFRVVHDPFDFDELKIRIDLSERRRDLSPTERDEETRLLMEVLWTPDDGRFGLVEVWDDQNGKCVVECYRCNREFVIDRKEVAAVLAHAKKHGGLAYVTTNGIRIEQAHSE
jgi:hypothetical protein